MLHVESIMHRLTWGIPVHRYLIFDTHLLIEKFTYDQYIWASVTLYLDILNLFLKILQLLGSRNN